MVYWHGDRFQFRRRPALSTHARSNSIWSVVPQSDLVETNDVELPPLTARQQAFVREYLVDLNASQACIRAGYSPNGSNVTGSQLLANPNIAAAIEKGKASRAARIGMTADQVVHELSLLANASVEHYYVDDDGNLKPTDDAPEGAMRAIRSVKKKTRVARDGSVTFEVEFTLWDKPGQLKLMGKHVGVSACSDKVEVTGADGGPIRHAIAAVATMPADQLKDELKQLQQEAEDLNQ